MKRLVNHFLRGLVFLAPIGATLYVLVYLFRAIDSLLGLPYPGVGAVLLIVGITAIGFLLSNYLMGRVLSSFDGVLERLPFTKLLYTSMRDLMNAFVGEKKRFGTPAMVELIPGSKVKALGFLTRDKLEGLGAPLEDQVAVYFPQAYGFAGQLLIVPREQVTLLALESTDIMAFIVSGGVAGR